MTFSNRPAPTLIRITLCSQHRLYRLGRAAQLHFDISCCSRLTSRKPAVPMLLEHDILGEPQVISVSLRPRGQLCVALRVSICYTGYYLPYYACRADSDDTTSKNHSSRGPRHHYIDLPLPPLTRHRFRISARSRTCTADGSSTSYVTHITLDRSCVPVMAYALSQRLACSTRRRWCCLRGARY